MLETEIKISYWKLKKYSCVQGSYQALESDDLLALLALSEHGVAHLAEDGGLQLVVDHEGLFCWMDIETTCLDLPLEVPGVAVHVVEGRED